MGMPRKFLSAEFDISMRSRVKQERKTICGKCDEKNHSSRFLNFLVGDVVDCPAD
jgi:hypothetical protein